MSQKTSATGGYLLLSGGKDIAAGTIWHDLIVGITGLPGELVRPLWLPEPANTPPLDVSWFAVGLVRIAPIGAPQIRHLSAGEGEDQITTHEELTVQASAIGPACLELAALLGDGIHVPQNRHILHPAGLAFVRAEPITVTPLLVGRQWRNRADLPLVFRRERRRIASVLNLRCCVSSDSYIESQSGAVVPLIRCKE